MSMALKNLKMSRLANSFTFSLPEHISSPFPNPKDELSYHLNLTKQEVVWGEQPDNEYNPGVFQKQLLFRVYYS